MQTIAAAISVVNGAPFTSQANGVNINDANSSGIAAAILLAQAADVIVLAMGIDKSVECEGMIICVLHIQVCMWFLICVV